MLNSYLTKKLKAFTLIELMMTALIMGIIVCAAIPFAMKKDIQKRAVAGHIGVFECYYDENGELRRHVREKDGTEIDEPVDDGDTCTFNPNADYTRGAKNFQIIAIGGGGAGGTYNTHGSDDEVINAIHTNISSADSISSYAAWIVFVPIDPEVSIIKRTFFTFSLLIHPL